MMQRDFTTPFQWILDNRYRWLFHLFFWVLIYLDELLSLIGVTSSIPNIHLLGFEVGADMTMVYLNLYVLIPRFLLRQRPLAYIGLTLLTLVLNVGLMYYLYILPMGGNIDLVAFSITTFLTTGTLLGTAIGIKIFKIFIQKQQRLKELERANLETELAFLKDQINPHFLFNSLNNIYVLSRKRPGDTPEAILLLSDLLRYQLYECAREQVPLEGEIRYLENYIELDRLRKDQSDVSLKVTGDPAGHKIAPFLLLPFLENAFKHGQDEEGNLLIEISMDITGNGLEFQVRNDLPANPANAPAGGIGLANVQRRLELIYPDQHHLEIRKGKKQFEVELEIRL